VKCGSSEKLAKVEEPNRCEYAAELVTPAACNKDVVQQIQKQVAAQQRELEEDHDEL
jgi:hypothetical protein